MQAIMTEYRGPTNTRGSRIVAACAAGRLTTPWDHSLGIEQNHRLAAQRLRDKLGWRSHDYYPAMAGGSVHGGCYVFVFPDYDRDPLSQEIEDGFAHRSRLLVEQADITERRHGRVR